MRRLAERYPQLTIELTVDISPLLHQRLAENDFDMLFAMDGVAPGLCVEQVPLAVATAIPRVFPTMTVALMLVRHAMSAPRTMKEITTAERRLPVVMNALQGKPVRTANVWVEAAHPTVRTRNAAVMAVVDIVPATLALSAPLRRPV